MNCDTSGRTMGLSRSESRRIPTHGFWRTWIRGCPVCVEGVRSLATVSQCPPP